MDICIITDDRILGRCLVLEAEARGLNAVFSESAVEAEVYVLDLDYTENKPTVNSIYFSYDGERLKSAMREQDTENGIKRYFFSRPFDISELSDTAARMAAPANLNKASNVPVFYRSERKVAANGREVRLSVREAELLFALCSNGSLSRTEAEELFECANSNVVDVYIHYLRKKLQKVYTGETVTSKRGEGYCITADFKIEP